LLVFKGGYGFFEGKPCQLNCTKPQIGTMMLHLVLSLNNQLGMKI